MSCNHAKCTLCGKCLTCQPHAPHTRVAGVEHNCRFEYCTAPTGQCDTPEG